MPPQHGLRPVCVCGGGQAFLSSLHTCYVVVVSAAMGRHRFGAVLECGGASLALSIATKLDCTGVRSWGLASKQRLMCWLGKQMGMRSVPRLP